MKSPTKAQKCEKHDTKQTVKSMCVYSMRAQAQRQSVILFNLSWEHARWALKFFTCWTCACLRLTMKVIQWLDLSYLTGLFSNGRLLRSSAEYVYTFLARVPGQARFVWFSLLEAGNDTNIGIEYRKGRVREWRKLCRQNLHLQIKVVGDIYLSIYMVFLPMTHII